MGSTFEIALEADSIHNRWRVVSWSLREGREGTSGLDGGKFGAATIFDTGIVVTSLRLGGVNKHWNRPAWHVRGCITRIVRAGGE